MGKKTGIIKNIIDQSMVNYLLDYYNKLPKADNGLRINADTLIDQDFNNRFKDKMQNIINKDLPGSICHCTIYKKGPYS